MGMVLALQFMMSSFEMLDYLFSSCFAKKS